MAVVGNLTRAQVGNLYRVKKFLRSKGINSENTAKNYLSALVHLNNLVYSDYNHNVETILESLKAKKIDVYDLLDSFVSDEVQKNSPKTARIHLSAAKSYLQYSDADINDTKYKHRVTKPRQHKTNERPIDAEDIRKILLGPGNRRLKTYIQVLGMREVEALSIRHRDIDFIQLQSYSEQNIPKPE